MEKTAVIIIDMLNDFVTGDLKCKRAELIIPNLKKLIETARKHNVPVIYSNDAHLAEDMEVVRKWGKHAIKGTKGAEVIPQLKPAKKDYIVDKRTYSGFYETGLDPLLRSLYKGEGAKAVILGGLHTNICVRHTAADAFFRVPDNNSQRRRRSLYKRRPRTGAKIFGERLQRKNNDGQPDHKTIC